MFTVEETTQIFVFMCLLIFLVSIVICVLNKSKGNMYPLILEYPG